MGLDGRIITHSAYANVTLQPQATQTITVLATDFPIRPVGTEANLNI